MFRNCKACPKCQEKKEDDCLSVAGIHLKLEMGTLDFFVSFGRFFYSFKKLISFIFKIIVNFSSYFVLFLPEWSFSKIFRSVQYNWLFNETVHSVKKDIFFNLFEKIGCSVKNVLFYFVSKLVRSVKNPILFPNLSYSVKFVQTILNRFSF